MIVLSFCDKLFLLLFLTFVDIFVYYLLRPFLFQSLLFGLVVLYLYRV